MNLFPTSPSPPRAPHPNRLRRGSSRAPLLFLTLALLSSAAVVAQEIHPPWLDDEDAILEALAQGQVLDSERIGTGVTNPWKVRLEHRGQTLKAVWKPIDPTLFGGPWESYRSEVAAYRLSRLLGLDLVPPTVERKIGKRWGSLQFWVDGHRQYAKVRDQQPPTPLQWSRQFARMRFFDELIDNPDRNAGNFLVDDRWRLVLIDHSRALGFATQGRARTESPPIQFDPVLVERARSLDVATLEAEVGELLTGQQLRALLHSRDRLLRHVDQLSAERGEAVVFFSE